MGIKTRKVILRILTVLLIIITVVLAVRAFLNYAMGRKLESALRRAKAEGVPISSRELIPTCSELDNGAPLWKAAEALFIMPKGQERVSAVKAVESLFDGFPIDALPQSAAAAWIAKNRRALWLILEASSMKCFRFNGPEEPLPKNPGTLLFSRNYPDPTKLLQAARLIALDCLIKAQSGDPDGALEECRRGIRFFTRLLDSDYNFLMTTLVTTHCRKILTASFNRIAQGRDLETPMLSDWIKELDEVEWRKIYFRGLRAEGVFSLEWGLATVAGNRETLEGQFRLTRECSRFHYWLIRPLLKFQVLGNLEVARSLDRLYPLPYFRQKAYFEKQGTKLDNLPWYRRPLGQWMPNYQFAFLKETALEAMMLATKSGLACKIYKNSHGRYPESLEALVPGILNTVPIDPFTEKPLVYRLTSDEVLIYSLGSNERDDGGQGNFNISRLVMEKDDDWAWREKIR